MVDFTFSALTQLVRRQEGHPACTSLKVLLWKLFRDLVWYGILEFNVPLNTVYSETWTNLEYLTKIGLLNRKKPNRHLRTYLPQCLQFLILVKSQVPFINFFNVPVYNLLHCIHAF